MKSSLTFIDLFSGGGGFRMGMELAVHVCLGHCEIDKHADNNYRKMFDIKKEEWNAKDIRRVYAGDIPRANVWCAGFPCQDFTTNGKQRGLRGERSSLVLTIVRIIGDLAEEDRPELLFLENVENFLRINGGWDFLAVLSAWDSIGYDAEWQLINSFDHGVPQSRERVFIVAHRRGTRTAGALPLAEGIGEHYIHEIGGAADREHNGLIGEIERPAIQYAQGYIDETERPGIGDPEARDYIEEIERTSEFVGPIPVREGTKKGYVLIYPGDSVNLEHPTSKTRRGRRGPGRLNTLTTSCNFAYHDGRGLRRFTLRELYRAQGWPDDRIDRVLDNCSDAQHKKQIGNGVTVNVVRAIAERLAIIEDDDPEEILEAAFTLAAAEA